MAQGPPPGAPPPHLFLTHETIHWTLGESLRPEDRRFLHDVPDVQAYYLIAPENVVANYGYFLNSPALYASAAPLSGGGLRMWFRMGRMYDSNSGEHNYIWWACDLRQAYIMR